MVLKKKNIDFNSVVFNKFKFLNDELSYTVCPQYKYTEGINPNFIGREESFENDFNFIKYKLFNKKIKTKNKNVINKRDNFSKYKYIKYYDKKTIEFVNNFYYNDFILFNYEFINLM